MFRPSTMVLFFIGLLIAFTSISQSSTSTYSNGIIPFSFNTYDAGCNGPMSPLVVNIPAGSTVTSIEISYDVIAGNGAWMSEQRTAVHCHETGGTEGAISGSGGNSGGTESYNRTGVGIANGFSASGVLTFEMRAWRTWGGTTCETSYQNVVNNTWSIKVNYMIAGPIVSPGGVPNAEVWFDASNGAVGSPVTQWNNLGVNSNIPSLTSPSGGTFTNSDLKANYNSVITTTGGYSGTFHAEVSNRNQLIAGNQVTMYVAYLGNNAPDLTFEFHGSVQTSASSNGANQWLTWGFRHGGMGVLYSNGTGFAYNTPSIAGISHNSAFAGLNGTANSSGSNTLSGNDLNYGNIGSFHTGGNFMELSIGYWPGYGMSRGVMEAILWDDNLSSANRSAVESYLAIKYGITLGVNGISENYVSPSNGSVIWNVASNTGYNYDIAGISRADVSALDQRKSHSTNGPVSGVFNDILTISNGVTFSNPSAFSADDSHLIWGHNNTALINTGAVVNYPTDNGESVQTIFQREWKSQETGSVGSVTLEFDLSSVLGVGGVNGANNLADVRLLVDEDGDYSVGATSIAPSSFNNATGVVYFQHDFQPGTANQFDQQRGFFFSIGSVNMTTSPLPIELISFEVSNDGCSNFLSWKTSSEYDNSKFILERSFDLNTWKLVGLVNGAGHSIGELDYSYRDFDFENNGKLYYRLKQEDFDGEQEVVGIQVIDVFCENNVEPSIYPNPAQNKLNIQSYFGGVMKIVDVNSRVMMEEVLSIGTTPFSVYQLAKGMYILELQLDNGKRYTKPFIKE